MIRSQDEEDFRQCMRRLAATVSVIACEHDGHRHGITITSVASVSFAPLSILCCINRGSSISQPLMQAGKYSINLLDKTQADISLAFSGTLPPHARFTKGQWRATRDGVPFLSEAQATLICVLDQAHEYATHDIVVGRVVTSTFSSDVAPLLYQNGGFSTGVPIPAGAA